MKMPFLETSARTADNVEKAFVKARGEGEGIRQGSGQQRASRGARGGWRMERGAASPPLLPPRCCSPVLPSHPLPGQMAEDLIKAKATDAAKPDDGVAKLTEPAGKKGGCC